MKIQDIYEAEARIRPYLSPTPLIFSSLLAQRLNKNVWLKMETQNPTGSFKSRPAFNSILAHLKLAQEKGVIASSSGNFAQGVAYGAFTLNVNALIVMTASTLAYKIARTKSWGAEVAISGDSHGERMGLTEELQLSTGRLMLHPYNSLETIAGDGTVGLELSRELGEILDGDTAVLVPVSGGGLIAGIAFVLKSLHPTCKIIGVQSAVSGTLKKSLQANTCVNVGKYQTIADALVASALGEIPFEIIKNYVDDAIVVEENKIRQATQYMLEEHKLVTEPAAALPIAALVEAKVSQQNIICIATGGNMDLKRYGEII